MKFLIFVFIEIAFSVPIFAKLGIIGTFVELIASAFLGFVILANSKFTLNESLSALRNGAIDSKTFQTINIMTIVGAFMLILPGIFTDILGILAQFGFMATLMAKYISKKDNTNIRREEDEDIIDVEVIDTNTK